MAASPQKQLVFEIGCGDCGERRAVLPGLPPQIDDDFDWQTRDYDGFRLFMMEELAHRFPARKRWTPADMEAVIVEALAAALDRLSHALDTVQAERFLDTARRPQSVRRLLAFVGYDPLPGAASGMAKLSNIAGETSEQKLERYWSREPAAMDEARRNGPREIREQRRMVTLADHVTRLESHPLIKRAKTRLKWTGAWNSILAAVLLVKFLNLDEVLVLGGSGIPVKFGEKLWREIEAFHAANGLPLPAARPGLTPRGIVAPFVESRRMAGTEVILTDTRTVPLSIALSVKAKLGYFGSELRDALNQAFSSDDGGFFESGNLGFGDDVNASDLIERAIAVEGAEVACLTVFKRMGGQYPNRADATTIAIADDEIAVCANEKSNAKMGRMLITVHGGNPG